jgi:hypothetical protein
MRKVHTATAAALVTLAATFAAVIPASPASAGGPIKITAAYYDPVQNGPDPDTNAGRNTEYIVIRNGGSKSLPLTGFVLHDAPRLGSTNRFVFPKFTLRAGKSVRIHTGSGSNNATDLYWGKTVYVWGDDSDTATLVNRSGSNVSVCSWGVNSTSPHYC